MSYIKPLQIGNLKIANNLIYAALAGCSDYAYRKMALQYERRPGLIFCEMVKMEPLVRRQPATMDYLKFDNSMHPLAAQVVGSNLSMATESAKIIEDQGFDLLDFNCGCPVDKVIKDGSGSGMLKNLDLMGEILSKMVAAVDIPVTIKVRAGWTQEDLCYKSLVKIAEQAGAKALTLHGRTRAQGYSGEANWQWIKECKAAAKEILIFGNGDVFTPEKALLMFKETGCDGIVLARGTFGQPWFANNIIEYINSGNYHRESLFERKAALHRHFNYLLESKPERNALLEMRRIGCWYSKGLPGACEFRSSITKAEGVEDVLEIIERLGG